MSEVSMSKNVVKFSVEFEEDHCKTCLATITAVNGEGQEVQKRLDLSGNAIPCVKHGVILALKEANAMVGNRQPLEVKETRLRRKR